MGRKKCRSNNDELSQNDNEIMLLVFVLKAIGHQVNAKLAE